MLDFSAMRVVKSNSQPSFDMVDALNDAFNHFNRELFQSSLPLPMFAYQRKKNCRGHFSPGTWHDAEDEARKADEISLNPDYLKTRDHRDVLSTLVHEMVHQRQFHQGTPSRNGYHNAEWGTMMKEIGLYPSNTGEPGGKETGQQMTHYEVEGGAFSEAVDLLLLRGWKFPWVSENTEKPTKPRKPPSKVKFTCPCCNANAWGKPDLNVACGDCEVPMLADS